MTDSLIAGTVLFAKDLDQVAAFYSKVVGLRESERGPDVIVLKRDGFELVVHAIPKRIAASIVIAKPPRRREEVAIKPVFEVPSIDVARTVVDDHGGALNPPAGEWRFRGWRACDGQDPEGNVFQLRELLAAGDSE